MSQTRRRAASHRRSYAEDDSMDIDAHDEHAESMDEDFEPTSRAGRNRPATQPPAKRPRQQASQHPKQRKSITDYYKDTNTDSLDNDEANDDHDISSEENDEEDEDDGAGDRPGRPRSGAGRRGRGRGGADTGSRHGAAAGRGRGKGGRGAVSIKTEPGLGLAAVGPIGGGDQDMDVICLISSSDTDGDVRGGGAGASQLPAKRGRGRPFSRGGRAAAGGGRGRSRGGDSDDGGGLEDDAAEGEAGARQVGGTQRQAYMAPTAPLQIDPEELTRMRRLVKRYRDEWEAAKEKCAVWNEISEAERNQLAAAVVRYMLFSSRAKPQHPVPRAKLAEAVKKAMGSTHRHLRKLATVWLPWARHKAISCMGLDIAELSRGAGGGAEAGGEGGDQGAGAGPSTSAAAAGGGEGGAGGEGSGQYFVLRTALPTSLRVEFVGSDGAGEEEAGLRLAVLALIQYNRGKMDEDMLRRLLGQMGFDPSAATHPRFPALHDLLKKLADQRYLAVEKETGADGGTVCSYSWGDAAHSEVTPAALTKMCDRLMDGLDTTVGDGGGGAAA